MEQRDLTSTSFFKGSLRDALSGYLKRWYWFVLGVVLALLAGHTYLRYSTELFLSKATVIVKEEKSSGLAELSAFSNLGGLLRRFNRNQVEDELAIFKSRRLISAVIEKLDLNVRYESVGAIKATELYDHRPFNVQFLEFKKGFEEGRSPRLLVTIESAETFVLEIPGALEPTQFNYGEPIELYFGNITVIPSLDNAGNFEKLKGTVVGVKYNNIEKLAQSYQQRLVVVNEMSNSNIVSLSMTSAVRAKAEDFINELIFQYNQDAMNDQSQVAIKTSDFINQRLEIITRELDSVEYDKEEFKSQNRLTNIEAEAQLILENASEFEKRQFDVNTQLELANSMIEYLESTSSNDLLPSNIGLETEGVASQINNYNLLILQRNRLLKYSTAKNPVVININKQIEDIRSSIRTSLINETEALKLSLRDLNYQENQLNSKLSKVPTNERIFRGIERQQTIKEQLYLFLLQQREEANISMAVTAAKAKVVDAAISSGRPVYPNKKMIYLASMVLGLALPFGLIYFSELLNNKVNSREDVDKILTDIRLIGEFPKLKRGSEQLIDVNDRSILAESFRILRTNLQYLFINKMDKGQAHSIFVTSTIKGEGKTFVAFNLALTLALTGKRVVLVGADIRNPQLQRYLPAESRQRKGLTEYIVDETVTIEELKARSSYNQHLDIILSGAIPPNPAELLMQSRTEAFFTELRSMYDYVIVDTAPSMLVTDTIIINKLADITLYVIRAGHTEKKLLEFPRDAVADGRLVNVTAVLNNVAMSNFGYGNKYGYSYSSEKVSWWKRTFQRS